MKRVVVSMRNTLLTEAIMRTLNAVSEFRCERILPEQVNDTPIVCQAKQADILLMEVACSPGFSVAERLKLRARVREEMPECKTVLLCDEIAQPEMAREVMLARQDRRVDGFFYTSVTADYMVAALQCL